MRRPEQDATETQQGRELNRFRPFCLLDPCAPARIALAPPWRGLDAFP